MTIVFAFVMLCISVCLFIRTVVDDVSATIERSNRNIDQSNLVIKNVIYFIELHLHCYRFFKEFSLKLFGFCKFLNKKILIRIMEMLEDIIGASIFIQISTFALKMAINTFSIETVSAYRFSPRCPD